MARRPPDTPGGLSFEAVPEWRSNAPNRLRELRLDRKLSYDALGKLIVPPVDGSTVMKLEKGPRHGGMRMNLEWMHRLARALDCHPSDLLIDLPPTTLTPREQDAIARYRSLAEPDRDAVDLVLDRFITAAGAASDTPPHDPAAPDRTKSASARPSRRRAAPRRTTRGSR